MGSPDSKSALIRKKSAARAHRRSRRPKSVISLLRYITLSYNKITATFCLHEKSRRADEFAEKHCGFLQRSKSLHLQLITLAAVDLSGGKEIADLEETPGASQLQIW